MAKRETDRMETVKNFAGWTALLGVFVGIIYLLDYAFL